MAYWRTVILAYGLLGYCHPEVCQDSNTVGGLLLPHPTAGVMWLIWLGKFVLKLGHLF
jgi:hypothetical protein